MATTPVATQACPVPCRTPGAVYHTYQSPTRVVVYVTLPTPLDLDEQAATVLEERLHRATEAVLADYWPPSEPR